MFNCLFAPGGLTQTSQPNKTKLISRQADFWLLGGASIVVWFVLLFLRRFEFIPQAKSQINNVPFMAASLAVLINYPHFMASYKIAYSRGQQFIKKNWVQLILVPIVLIAVCVYAWLAYRTPNFLKGQHSFFDYATQGQMLLGLLVNLMFLSVGWHYSKQVFGCVMVYAKYDNYELTNLQRIAIRYSLLSIWWLTFVKSNAQWGTNRFFDLQYMTLGLPVWSYNVVQAFYIFTTSLVFIGVFWRNYRQRGQWPSANMLIPYLAFQVWWVPEFQQNDFYMYLTPFFHSLQYLVFVVAIERFHEQSNFSNGRSSQLVRNVFLLIFTGWLAFELLPGFLDTTMAKATMGVGFFLIAANLFINIHHYFIDNTIWRLGDENVRKSLF